MRQPFMKSLQAFLLGLTLCCVASADASTPHIPGGPKVADCSKARDPDQCEARVAARKACQHKQGSSKRQCMDARRIVPECRPANDPVKCSQQERADYICRQKTGKAFKECTRQEVKKFRSRI